MVFVISVMLSNFGIIYDYFLVLGLLELPHPNMTSTRSISLKNIHVKEGMHLNNFIIHWVPIIIFIE